jgi:glycosyltransferase involved in cell wall biosynthesis
MKIVHYLNHSVRGNGHVAVAVDLACEQARVGHDVYLASAAGDFDDLLIANNVHIVRVPEHFGALRVIKMAADFFKAMRTVRPDVVNAHMVAAALAARLVKPFYRFRIVTTVHNSFDRQAILMRVGDRVITVSDSVGQEMAQRGIAAAKLRTVTNGTVGGVRRPRFDGKPYDLQHPAVVTVCGLHSRKGVAHLINGFDEARASCPDAHLYLVGDGPERAEFEAHARSTSSTDHIHFLGYREDPRDVLATAELFVLASLRDPCPLVIFEAREMGNPIIATSVDGIPAALAHGKRGILVPPADARALATEIVRVLTDDHLRASLSKASLEDPYDITVERMSADTVAVYAETLGARAADIR